MSIHALPNELIFQITAHLPPSDVLYLALSCSQICASLANTLIEYNQIYKQEWVRHNRNPWDFLQLVRSSTSGHLRSWFLNRIEFWGTRHCWGEWRNFNSFDCAKVDHKVVEPSYNYSTLRSCTFTKAELKRYYEIIAKDLHLPDKADEWIQRICCGDEGRLRLLLLATSPALSQVVFVQHDPPYVKPPMNFFNQAIESCAKSAAWSPNPWPPGFLSLKSLLVNVHPSEYLSTPRPGIYDNNQIASFFLLPNLKHLHVYGVGGGRPEHTQYFWNVAPRSSQIESLILESDTLPLSCHLNFIKSIKTLKHLECGGQSYMNTEIAPSQVNFDEELVRLHGTTLEYAQRGSDYSSIDFAYAWKLPALKYYQIDLSKSLGPNPDQRWLWDNLHAHLPPSLDLLSIRGISNEHEQLPVMLEGLRKFAQQRRPTLQDICLKLAPSKCPNQGFEVSFQMPDIPVTTMRQQHLLNITSIRRQHVLASIKQRKIDEDLLAFRTKCEPIAADLRDKQGLMLHISEEQEVCDDHAHRHGYRDGSRRCVGLHTEPSEDLWRINCR